MSLGCLGFRLRDEAGVPKVATAQYTLGGAQPLSVHQNGSRNSLSSQGRTLLTRSLRAVPCCAVFALVLQHEHGGRGD